MFSHIKHTSKELISPQAWRGRLVFWTGAILVGLAAVLFAEGSDYAYHLHKQLMAISPWATLILAPAGLVLIAWLNRKLFPGAQGSGIPQAIAAIEMTNSSYRRSLLTFRIAIGKILLTLMGLSCGASIGREGPSVHIGAAIMFSLGRLAKLPSEYLERGLILAGGAAGISAAFNTPLAGIIFAIEEMSRSFEQRSSGTLLTAVVIAGITAVALLGNYTYFGVSNATLDLVSSAWLAVFAVSIAGGVAGGLFSLFLIRGSRWIAPWHNRRPLMIAAICGVTIAIIGLVSGGTSYGTGYDEARILVTGEGDLDGSYAFFKILATIASYLSGIPGGIFAPSLATGAGIGDNMARLFTSIPADAIVIIGMVAYFSAVVQAPITSIVIVMEMTANQTLLLPIMAASFIAYVISRTICPEPIYRALALPFLELARKEETPKEPDPSQSDRTL